MRVTVKQANGLNFTKDKLYKVIKVDWDKGIIKVMDDLGREVYATIWMFNPPEDTESKTFCLTKKEFEDFITSRDRDEEE